MPFALAVLHRRNTEFSRGRGRCRVGNLFPGSSDPRWLRAVPDSYEARRRTSAKYQVAL